MLEGRDGSLRLLWGWGVVPGELYVLILQFQRCYSVRGKSEGCLRLCVCEGGGGGGGAVPGEAYELILTYSAVTVLEGRVRAAYGCCVQV